MTVTIGIFDQEVQVLDAIRMLRDAGASAEELRVVVDNREGAPLIASEEGIHLEEVYEIRETLRDGRGDGPVAWGGAVAAAGGPSGNLVFSNGAVGGAVAYPGADFEDGPGTEDVLREIGVPGRVSDRGAKAIDGGKYLLVADPSDDIEARSIMERAGAFDVD